MRRPLPSVPLRPALAAIAAAVLSSVAPADARASQEDCFVEAPAGPQAGPKAEPAPRRKGTPAPSGRPSVRIAGDAADADAAAAPRPADARMAPAAMRKVPVECAPRPVREIRVESAPADGTGRVDLAATDGPPAGPPGAPRR